MQSYKRLELKDGVTVVNQSLFNHLENSLEQLCEIAKDVEGTDGIDITNLSNYEPINGYILVDGTWGNINDNYKHIVIPVSGNKPLLSMTANDSFAVYYSAVRSYEKPIKGTVINFSQSEGWTTRLTLPKGHTLNKQLPADAKFLIISVLQNNNDIMPVDFHLFANFGGGKVNDLIDRVSSLEKIGVNYLALGDSITEGYYSTQLENSEDMEFLRAGENSYVSTLAKLKGYNLTNKGVGGSGWLKRGTTLAPKKNAREQIDAVNEDGSYVIDFTKYDLCTLCWGVNDWKGCENLGTFEDGLNPEVEFVYANIRYCIETIMQRNPNLKLIVISPVNSRRGISTNPQSAEHNWGIGYEFNGKTLEDFYNAIKTVCEYYGIEFIDMLHNSVINRLNAVALLPDEVHPSLEAHILMGKPAGKILYGC